MTTLERALSYLVGGIAGLVIAFLYLSLHVPADSATGIPAISYWLAPENRQYFMTIELLAFVIGLLMSNFLSTERQKAVMRRNDERRNEAITIITHEMRTALTSASWEIDYILKTYPEALRPSDRKTLQTVIDAIKNTVTQSVNLLDITMMDMGKFSPTFEWTTVGKLEPVLTDIVEVFRHAASINGIVLVSTTALNREARLHADRARVLAVLENILENSILYSSGDKKEITVRMETDDKWFTITVKDTGIGIPEGVQKKIFGKFFRAKNAQDKVSTGSGLGLYLCKQYVEAHRGSISFESKENVGTTFTVRFPLNVPVPIEEFFAKI